MKGILFACAVLVAAVTGCPEPSYACHRCGRSAAQCVFKAQVVAVPQPVIAYQSLNYFIGAPIRAEAAVAEALRSDPIYREFLKYKAWKEQQQGQPTPAAPPAALEPMPDPLPAQAEFGAVAANCAKCHSGATPAGKITIDGQTPLSPTDANRAQIAVLEGRMPKKGQLTPEARGEVLADLIFLAKPKEKTNEAHE